ncbi:predicted protein [Lichtheimia corymbifera JMRC:FSU:9682]|uniref:Uncharacterized protein n=1 Tax=Lichtheimia corymbifera JMRC:FSU:9682 TaxID=1263082 RepID=A0A068S165_9FUNG|nr:predicted protein [Lichtheimia corymbifera JMRC:FSU:9682]
MFALPRAHPIQIPSILSPGYHPELLPPRSSCLYRIPALRMPQRFATSVAPDVQITLFMWHLRRTESPFHVECTLEAQNLYGNQIYPPDQGSP